MRQTPYQVSSVRQTQPAYVLMSDVSWPHCGSLASLQERLKAEVPFGPGVSAPKNIDPQDVYAELLVGQPYVKETLAAWLSVVKDSCDRAPPKAFLFAGNRGSGKTRSALMVAEAKSGLLRYCRREGGDRFTYGDTHACLERHGLLMMGLQEWKDEGTAQLKFRNLMSRKCPTLILDDIQAVEDASKLLAPFKSCIDPVVARYTFSDGTVHSCTGLTLVLTGQVDCFWDNAANRCCHNPRMYFGANPDTEVKFVAETLSQQHNSLGFVQAVGRARLQPFLENWLGTNVAPMVNVVPFYASSEQELHTIALKQATETFHCSLCDVCGDVTFLLDNYVHAALKAKPQASGRDIAIPILQAKVYVDSLRKRCEESGRVETIEFGFKGFAAAASVKAIP